MPVGYEHVHPGGPSHDNPKQRIIIPTDESRNRSLTELDTVAVTHRERNAESNLSSSPLFKTESSSLMKSLAFSLLESIIRASL